MKQEIKVEIFKSNYIIRSEVDEEYTRQLAEYVDNKMNEAAEGTDTVSNLKIAILAALNISSELFHLKEMHHQQKDLIEEKAAKLISILDNNLESPYDEEKIA